MHSLRRACCGVALALLALPAVGQITRPEHAGRVVRAFDFEEPVVGTIRLPDHWVRAQHDPKVPRDRPGFPIWNAAELDDTVAAGGQVSVRVPVDGGSASLRLEPGVLPVFPGADYRVMTKVRTSGTKGSRARLVARLLDANSGEVPGSVQSSRLVQTFGEWTSLEVAIHGDFEDAAFLQIDLDLVQGREYLPARLGEHQVFRDDHGAAAWFDDVLVLQLPRVVLNTSAPFNIFLEGETPEIRVDVRDLTGRPLRGVLRVQDDEGRTVDETELSVPPGRFKEDWTPALTRLGWYRGILELRQGEMLVGATHVDFAWTLGTSRITDGEATLLTSERTAGVGRLGGGSIDRSRFGLDVAELDERLLTALPALIKRLGVGAVTLPAWEASTSSNNVEDRAARLSDLAAALGSDWVDLTLAFSRLPDEVMELSRLQADDPLELVTSADPALWRPLTNPILDQLGPRVSRWQIGPAGDDSAFWLPAIAGAIEPVDQLLLSMVTTPEVVLPWRADRAYREVASPVEGTTAGTAMLVPSTFGVEALEHLGAAIDAREGSLTLVFEVLDAETYGHRASVDNLVKRAVAAWGSFDQDTLRRMDLMRAWEMGGARGDVVMPGAPAAAWRNLIERLAERRRIGRFPGLSGVHCEILDEADLATPDRGGVLVAWREPDHEGRAVLEAPLGEGPVRVIDVYGNEQVVWPQERSDGMRVHVVPVTGSPVFIEDVDVKMVRFVSSFRLEPGLISSMNDQHEVSLTLTNPWPMTIAGRITILQPGGTPAGGGAPDRTWQIHPRSQVYSIEPGETKELVLSMAFSPYEESGLRELIAEASVSADREYGAVRLVAPFEIGLEDLEMELTYRFGKGSELIIEAVVTNTGAEDVYAELRAFPPRMARMKLPAVHIPTGQTVTRRFVIEGGAGLVGESVSVNLSSVDRGGMLNRRLAIE